MFSVSKWFNGLMKKHNMMTVAKVKNKDDIPSISHHMDNNMWGCHVRFTEWPKCEIWGHMHRDCWGVGHTFACSFKSGETVVFRVKSLQWQRDPNDMFFGTAEIIGFSKDLPERVMEPRIFPVEGGVRYI